MQSSKIITNCPHCQQIDQVQKISAIYTGGLSNSQLSGSMRSSGTVGYGTPVRMNGSINLNGQNQTYLSQKFIPPKKPSRPIQDLLKSTAIAVVLSFVTFVFVTIIFQPKPGNIWFFISTIVFLIFLISCITLVLLLFAAFFYLYVKRTPSKTYQERLNHWQKLCSIWDTTYYCHRCDIVYNPNQPGQVSSVQNASQFYT